MKWIHSFSFMHRALSRYITYISLHSLRHITAQSQTYHCTVQAYHCTFSLDISRPIDFDYILDCVSAHWTYSASPPLPLLKCTLKQGTLSLNFKVFFRKNLPRSRDTYVHTHTGHSPPDFRSKFYIRLIARILPDLVDQGRWRRVPFLEN